MLTSTVSRRPAAERAQGAGEGTRRDPAMLRVMTYNICFGGVDDDMTNRLPLIHDVVRAGRPDVLAVQEANEFDERQYRRLFAFERATGFRGLLDPDHNGALFIRPDL